MFSTLTRMIVVFTASGLGVAALWQGHRRAAFALFFIAAVMLYSWVRYGAVTAARRQFRAGRIERAWGMLQNTPLGGRLMARGMRPSFHLVRCACLIELERWAEVLPEAELVLAMKTNPANLSTAHAALSQAHLRLEDRDAARRHLRKARALPHKPGLDRLLARVAGELDGDGAA